MRALIVGLLCWLFGAASAQAHNLTMSVLTVRQLSDSEFVTSWSRLEGVHDKQAAYLVLRPLFPQHCQFEPPHLRCDEPGLTGRLGFAGLGELSSSATMRVEWRSAPAESFTFSAAQPQLNRKRAPGSQTLGQLASSFTVIGVEHIWLGWDHLLFVLGLLWLVRTPRALVGTISAFTLAHSVTLGAATLGLATLPVPPVEALIALSIAFVAVELIKRGRGEQAGLSSRRPWLIAFAFGLLHGFGFASALGEIDLPRADLPLALLFFNVGVELGQLAFVALAWTLRPLLTRLGEPFTRRATPLVQYAMGSVAMYWFLTRLIAFTEVGTSS